ncbi:hypothetical protein [Kribbella sindirgiensis]|uniref:Uncharacterized protein n=1 Tax=Kribbella sindirgiensis TaxID=1124744 RepID=A0A4R0IIB8_9ACTN|nr:hypothetical protein [Kribbella sindirgiensis]TCC32387.1 hypothetical protein E0H50_19550 [Kribbella sindirgiensis]
MERVRGARRCHQRLPADRSRFARPDPGGGSLTTAPLGHWTHSAEEDHDGISVYRRDDYAFPPARGRRGVEFRADGTFVEYAIGRGDAPEARAAGRWQAGGQLARGTGGKGQVVAATNDRLDIDWQD